MEKGTDLLRLDGIYSSGFGIVPKFVMHDRELTLESKAIYAYLCALAGSGSQTFPYRDTILRDLGLSKNTYYRHYKPLIDQGYIAVERPGDKTAANIYTLVSNPKKLDESSTSRQGEHSLLRYRGLKAHGYGTIPRQVMRDSRLSVKARGLYAYFCSYCGAGDCAFPHRDHILHHLGITEPTYYKAYNQLQDRGYLVVAQRKCGGRFAVNDYYLNEHPGLSQKTQGNSDALPYPKNCDMESPQRKERKNTDASPCPKIWDTKNGDTIFGDTKNCDSYIESKNSVSSNSTSTISPSKKADRDGLKKNKSYQKNPSPHQSLRIVRSGFHVGVPDVLLDLAVETVDDLLLKKDKPPRAGQARERLVKIAQEQGEAGLYTEMERFLHAYCIKRMGRKVKNPAAYFRTSLCNWLLEEQEAAKNRSEQHPTASYDLDEMDRMIEEAAFL